MPWLDDCSRTAPLTPPQGRLECLGISGWIPSESPAALRRNARLVSVGIRIYGYLNRVRSSRRLEAEIHRNIEAIWLLRHLKPDFKTIADFRRDNRNAFRPIFRQFVLLCRQLDLFGRELLAVAGTRIKAVNNKDRNFTRASLTKFIELATPSSTTICNGLTRAMPAKARPVARGSRTSLRRSPQFAGGAHAARPCWDSWTRTERTRYR